MEFTYFGIGTGLMTTREIESPIEIMFCDEFKLHSSLFKAKYDLYVFDLNPQYPVECDGKTYFVDFGIDIISKDGIISQQYAVECDGHDFHEKTKEQAMYDKQRERLLLDSFSKVIRFSGSEIYNNANKCVEEVLKIIQRDLRLQPNNHQVGGY